MKNNFNYLFSNDSHYLIDITINLAEGIRAVKFLCTCEDGNKSDYYFEDRFKNSFEVKKLPYLEEFYSFYNVRFIREYTFNLYFPGLSTRSNLLNKIIMGWKSYFVLTRYLFPKVSLIFTLCVPFNSSNEEACKIIEKLDKSKITNKVLQYKNNYIPYDRELTLEYDFIMHSIRQLYEYINFDEEDVVKVGYLGDLLPFSLGKKGFIVDKEGLISFFYNGNLWACGTQEHKKKFTFDEIASVLSLSLKESKRFGNKLYQIFYSK